MPLAKPEKIFTAILISIKDIDMLMRSCGNEKDNIKALRMIKEAQGLAYSIAGKLGYLKESVRKSNNLGEV